MQTYRFSNVVIGTDDPRFAGYLASAHSGGERPLCLCRGPEGIAMYVSRLGERYFVKRMPGSASRHHPDCESFEPPAELSGRGDVDGSAIQEDIVAGRTTLKLSFSLAKLGSKSTPVSAGSETDSVPTDGSRLSLRGVLHYLWEQAQLNRWTPGMAGKRSWYVVRKYLQQAAADKAAKGIDLTDLLFVPEQFSVERKDEILERRIAKLARIAAPVNGSRKLMLLIGEVKTFEPARYGQRMTVKHLPDLPFLLADDLHRRMLKRFDQELALWTADESTHLIVISTFGFNAAGVASLEELSLMTTTANWIPVEHVSDAQLLAALTEAGRRFSKGLRYNLASDRPLANAVLSDTETQPVALYVVPPGASEAYRRSLSELIDGSDLASWVWKANEEAMPRLPI